MKELKELTNIELYDELMPIIKQLCENFFFRDMKKYTLNPEETDPFFRLYDMSLEYEYSMTPDFNPDMDDDGEVRVKKGVYTYKQKKWNEIFNKVKEIWDKKHIEEFVLRYIKVPFHFDGHQYYEPHILDYYLRNKEYKSNFDYWSGIEYVKDMLSNDVSYMVENMLEFPVFNKKLAKIFAKGDYSQLLSRSLTDDDFIYFLLAMYRNYLNGLNGFKKNLDLAKDLIMYIARLSEENIDGRQSARPYALNGEVFYELGKCYENGILFEQSYPMARYCYLIAGEGVGKTYIPALGDMYYYGKGVEVNYDVAYMCYIDHNKHNRFAQDERFVRLSKREINKKFKNIEIEDIDEFDFEEERPEWLDE